MKGFLVIILIGMIETNCVNSKSVYEKAKIDKIEWSIDAALPSADGIEKHPGVAGPAVGIIDNRLLVAGGANFPGGLPWNGVKKVYHDEIYLFEKKDGHITNASIVKQKLPKPIAYCATTTTEEGVIYMGGESEQGISDKVVLITNENAGLQFSDLPALPLPLTNLSAAYHDHTIYVAGGNSKDGPSNNFFSLDRSKPGAGWKVMPDVPVKISFAVMVVQSNGDHDCIYLLGGRRKNENGLSDIFNTVYEFDLKNNQWLQKPSLPYGISAGTGIADGSTTLLLFGGDKGETFSKEEKLNALIKNETDEQRKNGLVNQRIALLEAHPGFKGEVLVYNTITGACDKLNMMPVNSPVTTTAIKWNDEIIIPSGEVKAGVRTPGILIGKIILSR
jgi:N-acetylneuraminate epimerase